jgi:hypothetical protein
VTAKPSSLRARIALLDGRIPADPDTLCCLLDYRQDYKIYRRVWIPFQKTHWTPHLDIGPGDPEPPTTPPAVLSCLRTGGQTCDPVGKLECLFWTRRRKIALDMQGINECDLDAVHPPPRT